MRFKALYSDAVRADSQPVRVAVSAAGLAIMASDESRIAYWTSDTLRLVEKPVGRRPFRVSNDDDSPVRLTFSDGETLSQLRSVFPDLRIRQTIPRRTQRQLAGWAAVGFAATIVLSIMVLPLAAAPIAELLPLSAQVRLGDRIGDHAVAILAESEGRRPADMACNYPPGVAALQSLVAPVAPRDTGGVALRIRVIDSAAPDILTAPGGLIILPRGIIDGAGGAEAFAGILAHEMAHAALRHPSATMLRSDPTTFLLGLLLGDVADRALTSGLGHQLLRAHYDGSIEDAADAAALDRLNVAGIDGRPFADLLDDMAHWPVDGETFAPSFPLRHPIGSGRSDGLRAESYGRQTVLSDDQWRDLRGICR